MDREGHSLSMAGSLRRRELSGCRSERLGKVHYEDLVVDRHLAGFDKAAVGMQLDGADIEVDTAAAGSLEKRRRYVMVQVGTSQPVSL